MSSVVDEFSILFFCVPVHPDPKPLPNTGLHVSAVAASPSNPSAVSANSVAGASAGGSSDNDGLDEDDEDMGNDHVSFAYFEKENDKDLNLQKSRPLVIRPMSKFKIENC